ncbi:MAG TPA: enoyl-CoA hydratase/isomerase family protein, partial [candidate division Zixibacteria bacterium]|nr:enoyl-CoA hydratase/isomerase family protein [candidate division Zixibacteria bacterium]
MFELTTQDSVITLTMAHGKANALDLEFCRALTEQFFSLSETDGAVILTGRGHIFSAGVDLKRVLADGAPYAREFLAALDELCKTLLTFDRPLLGALNGHAIAGGCVLAQACDFRVMAQGKGRIGVPELQVGVPMPVYVTEVMRQALSPAHFARVCYRGHTYTPGRALELGLVDALAEPEELMSVAQAEAAALAALSSAAFRLCKRQRSA